MAWKRALRILSSLPRTPCHSSATVTGEQKIPESLLLSSCQRPRIAISRARDTSMRMSESMRTEFKTSMSAIVFLCEAGEYRLLFRVTLCGSFEAQPGPPLPQYDLMRNLDTFHALPGEPVLKWKCPAAATGCAALSIRHRSNKAGCAS